MAKFIDLDPSKTYATRENANKAANKIYGNNETLRFIICCNEVGRFFPVFLGEKALQAGVVHNGFCVAG